MEEKLGIKKSLNLNNKVYRVYPGESLPLMDKEEAKKLVTILYNENKDTVLEKFMHFVNINQKSAEDFIKEVLESPKKQGRPASNKEVLEAPFSQEILEAPKKKGRPASNV